MVVYAYFIFIKNQERKVPSMNNLYEELKVWEALCANNVS